MALLALHLEVGAVRRCVTGLTLGLRLPLAMARVARQLGVPTYQGKAQSSVLLSE
jgi:hypothetical protein